MKLSTEPILASIEIPQITKTSSLPVDPDTPSTVSAVTLDEISDPTAIGQTIEVIEQDVVQLGSSPLRVRRVVVRLATLHSALQFESAPKNQTRQGHSRLVQIAEYYALSHTAERLYVTDLCEAAGVSERTLQYAFKELLGMTPVAYLNRLRLHRVRQLLRTATHTSTTVTKESLRWCFWHFGDFSRAYPSLKNEDIDSCISYAAELGRERFVSLTPGVA